jgi:hypothetical protein
MNEKTLHIDTPARYRIRVQGYLDATWAGRMGGMRIMIHTPSGKAPVTTLCGSLIDQAALLGVLNGLYSLRLPLLSVECLDIEPAEETAHGTD